MRFRLIPLEGGNPIDLVRDLTLIGRKEDCDIRLDNKSISKFHCIIAKTDQQLVVRDLGSTNGTKVNGQRIRRSTLSHNDQLMLANIPFKIKISNEKSPPPPRDRDYTITSNTEESSAELEALGKEEKGKDSAPIHSKLESPQNDLPDIYPSNS